MPTSESGTAYAAVGVGLLSEFKSGRGCMDEETEV